MHVGRSVRPEIDVAVSPMRPDSLCIRIHAWDYLHTCVLVYPFVQIEPGSVSSAADN